MTSTIDPSAAAAAAAAAVGSTLGLTPAQTEIYAGLSATEIAQLTKVATTEYNILTIWSPDAWAILFMFLLGVGMKVALGLMVSRGAVRRVVDACENDEGVGGGSKRMREFTKAALATTSRSVISHGLNLVISTICLALQLISWRAFCIPTSQIGFSDYTRLAFVVKLLLIGYGADILFADLNPSIYIHHIATFLLLFVGQIAVFHTKEYKFFQFAAWLLLQATTEQTTYLAMSLYHFSSYLALQDHLPRLKKSCLGVSWRLMVVTKWITYPQKLAPLGFALYWLSRMWNEMLLVEWGRAWLGLSTTLLVLLCAMQIYFCDQVFPLTDHVEWKLHGGPERSRVGPLAKLILPRRAPAEDTKGSPIDFPSPTGSESKAQSFDARDVLGRV